MNANFPFNDFHSFKDYVGFVKLCAPDQFPVREGVGASDQWTLELAFRGLNEGLTIGRSEGASEKILAECQRLFDAAFSSYRAGDMREGFMALNEVQRLIRKVKTQ